MRKLSTTILLAILVFSGLPIVSVMAITPTPSVEIKVASVAWGTNVNAPIKAYPGDTDVSLTVELQNYSPNETIKGVTALLDLQGSPFTDYQSGNKNATSTGTPVGGDRLNPPDYVSPRNFFTFTFTLDIDSGAAVKTYACNITVNYSVNVTRTMFVTGTPQTVTVNLIVSKPTSTISCSVNPTSVADGETIQVSGAINPVRDNATINLHFTKPDASTFDRTVQTKANSSYRYSYQPTTEGVWSVNASWVGDNKYSGDWASASFEVRAPVSLSVSVPDVILVGDREKTLSINLVNTGEVLLSSIDVTFSLASTASTPSLVIRGSSHWIINYLVPDNSTSIPVTVYAPSSALGSTYSASLRLNYRDDYGQSHTDTYNVGLIVKGWIELLIYEKATTPTTVNQGATVTVSATILNRGNAAAMYTNVTLDSNSILDRSTDSTAYIGEIDENSPVPFTLIARVKTDAADGVYPVTVKITYRDDQHVDHTLSFTLNLAVEKTQSSSTEQSTSLLSIISDAKWTIITVAGALLAVLVLYFRRVFAKNGLKQGRETE